MPQDMTPPPQAAPTPPPSVPPRAAFFETLYQAFSPLAPAVLVLLPLLAIYHAISNKSVESYDWTQYIAGLVAFLVAVLSVLLKGAWRGPRLTAVGGILACGLCIAMAGKQLLGIPWYLTASGALTGLGHWWANRENRPGIALSVVIGLVSILGFWAASCLTWWQPFAQQVAPPRAMTTYFVIIASVILATAHFERTAAISRQPASLSWIIDVVVIGTIGALVLRTQHLDGDVGAHHHWSVYVAPVELMREGGHLLGDVPSQYGFLSAVALYLMPIGNVFDGLYWLNCIVSFTAGIVLYLTLRSLGSSQVWRLLAGLIALSSCCFIPGYTQVLLGTLSYPSVGPMRFIWVYLLLGWLLWGYYRPTVTARVWVGFVLWLLGTFWASESLIYCTAIWFPAGTLLLMTPAEGFAPRLRAFGLAAGKMLALAGAGLATVCLLLTVYYHIRFGDAPRWDAYFEFARAFSNGFGAMPINTAGGVWVLVLIQVAFMALIVSADFVRHRAILAVACGAWGGFWAASSYFISRSHDNNINNIYPVLVLVTAVSAHLICALPKQSLARAWTWITVPPVFGAALWMIGINYEGLKAELKNYSVKPRASTLMPKEDPEIAGFLARCLTLRAGRYNVIGPDIGAVRQVTHADGLSGKAAWLPITCTTLLHPLSEQIREGYLERFSARFPDGGWLLFPKNRDNGSVGWLFQYLDAHFARHETLAEGGWEAIYYKRKQ